MTWLAVLAVYLLLIVAYMAVRLIGYRCARLRRLRRRPRLEHLDARSVYSLAAQRRRAARIRSAGRSGVDDAAG